MGKPTSALLCVALGWCEWETLPKPWDAERPIVPSMAFFRARRATHKMLGYGHNAVGARVLNWECLAFVGTSQQRLHPPLKSLHPGLRFYQMVFVFPLDFSNKQWNANIWPEGKTLSYWRGKEHDIQMTHGFVSEVTAVCHSLGYGFVVRCHMEWMCLGCEVNVNGFGRNSPVTSQNQFSR